MMPSHKVRLLTKNALSSFPSCLFFFALSRFHLLAQVVIHIQNFRHAPRDKQMLGDPCAILTRIQHGYELHAWDSTFLPSPCNLSDLTHFNLFLG